MARAYLALGANLGDPPAQLQEAIRRLDARPGIAVVARSGVVVSAPWGKTDQDPFHNQVIGVDTDLEPQDLLDICLGIEADMGRVRMELWGPRVIDIDLIAYEHREMRSSRLTLPHPYAHLRDFVLEPLREIAPEVADWVLEVADRPR